MTSMHTEQIELIANIWAFTTRVAFISLLLEFRLRETLEENPMKYHSQVETIKCKEVFVLVCLRHENHIFFPFSVAERRKKSV